MILEAGVLFALSAMLCWGIGDFLIQRSVRKVGDVEALAYIGIIGAVGLLPFVLGELHSLLEPANIFLMLGIGIVSFFIAILDFEALKKGKLSVVEVVLELELPVTAFLGVYFLKESVSMPQLAGVAIVFFGISIMAMKTLSLHGFAKIEKGVALAIVAAIGMGLINFLTAFGSKTISPLLVIWAPWVLIALFSLAYLMKKRGIARFVSDAGKYKNLVVATGVFDTLAWLSYSLAVQQNSVAITTAITESYPAVAMALGVYFNRERIKPHQMAGALLALAASIGLATVL